MQVAVENQQAEQSNKKTCIPPIIVDNPTNGKLLFEYLNHLTKDNHTSIFSGYPHNSANFVLDPLPKNNYWEERIKAMKANKLSIPAPTYLQKSISTTPVRIGKSPSNQVLPQITGPSTPTSITQENLTAQIL
ncbi:hypothetical protein CEXT_466451 [Caerostris extrusa]|uniref:Uncharacterized protein n=1 Tax=Caerostris extrusa TaxID=172846 RepID=A0AAV4PJ88_CAEEX|nr:hypothetical protein CEXT_466451 [Caerostris extrusa]